MVDRLATAGLAAGDDVVVGRADPAFVGAVAGELAAEAGQRELAAAGALIGEGAVADLLAARIVDREGDRAIAPDQGAVAGHAVQPRDVAAIVAIEDRGRAVGIVRHRVARHDVASRR